MLAAGAHGWHDRLAAVHREEGGEGGEGAEGGEEQQRWLVNHEANRSGEAVDALLGDERPCLGDVGRMVWRVESGV